MVGLSSRRRLFESSKPHESGTISELPCRSSPAVPSVCDDVTVHASNVSIDLDTNTKADDDPHCLNQGREPLDFNVETVYESDDDGMSSHSSTDWDLHDYNDNVLEAINAINIDINPAMGFPTHDLHKTNVTNSGPTTVNPDPDGIRAQIDTGAFVTCTDQLQLLHGYVPFSINRPCPVRLQPATTDSDAIPLGYGFFHVPAHNDVGFLAVRAFYTPKLRTTVIDERDLISAAGHKPKDIRSEVIQKHYKTGTFTYRAEHKLKTAYDVIIHGILRNGKCYTDILIPPAPTAPATYASLGPDFEDDCNKAMIQQIYLWEELQYDQLRDDFDSLPTQFHSLPFHEYIFKNAPVSALRANTERLLWHQRLGHVSDHYLYNAHKHIHGVPKFKHMDPILDQCPTCIASKMTKQPAGPNTFLH